MRAILEEYLKTGDPALFARLTSEEQRFAERSEKGPKKKKAKAKKEAAPEPSEQDKE